MAHKKAAGSAKNLRDSNPKYRGLKLAGGQHATAGNIIIRQKGDQYMCGNNTYKGKDFTIHAKVDGVVSFRKKKFVRFDGRSYVKTVVDILPDGDAVDHGSGAKSSAAKSSAAKKAEKKSKKKTTTKKNTTTKEKTETKKKADTTKKTTEKATTKDDPHVDDLTKIEGIGPVINDLLHDHGINTYEDLSTTKVGKLRDILADNDLSMHEPMPWKKQATMAKNDDWDDLKEYQEELKGGKED